MRFSTRSQVAQIPREIYEQEREIEWMFHNLVRFGRAHDIRNNEFVIWILVTVLGFLVLVRYISCGSRPTLIEMMSVAPSTKPK